MRKLPNSISDAPDQPIGFGYKCAWFAIRADDPGPVAAALGLIDLAPCSWRSGYQTIYSYDRALVFVTPPISQWVLAVGWALPTYQGEDFGDELAPTLRRLGAMFPDVQHFASHRIVGLQSWSRVLSGRLVRSFVYLGERGEVLRDEGEADEAERRMIADDRANWHPHKFYPEYAFSPEEGHVMEMAATWSIDPTKLEEMNLPPSRGWLGRPKRPLPA